MAPEAENQIHTINCRPARPAADSSPLRLAEEFAQRMACAWAEGQPLSVETLLGEHPRLNDDPEAVLRLILEEYLQARDAGTNPSSAEFLRRFPQLSSRLEMLFQCQELLDFEFDAPSPTWPERGESLGAFRLLEELGRGARGRVFLATQTDLADRLVVLKLSASDSEEHLSLARLQHTHIVPLFSAGDDTERNLRILCMPYFGGASLDRVLREVSARQTASLSGADLLKALDRLQASHPAPPESLGPSRAELARSSYVEAVCRFGAILAETLHHAHQRGLVHFDVKPSNVLLAADGQPMLLDFHLARAPVVAGSPAPTWLGGTPSYMAPEHALAFQAVRKRAIIQTAVDQRADIYSLGVLLHEALGGERPEPGQAAFAPVPRLNPGVSQGLEDIVHKCLAASPENRYTDAAALADDLRRHVDDRPLRHAPNRSWVERWRKWRRRRPLALRVIVLALVLLGALTAAAVLVGVRLQDYRHKAEQALRESRELMISHRHDDAVRRLLLGLDYSRAMPGNGELTNALERHLRLAQRARKAAEVHSFAETLRHAYLLDTMSLRMTRVLAAGCRQAWDSHEQLLDRGPALELAIEADIKPDLMDIAVCRADLGVRLASPTQSADARKNALRILEDAEKLLGGSPALYRERGNHARALGLSELEREANEEAKRAPARTACDHLALARLLLRDGEAERALAELNKVKESQSKGFLAAFHRGVCASRLKRHEDALLAFCECIGADPQSAESHLFRGRAFAALGRSEKSLADFDRALQLKPRLAEAALGRGLLHVEERRFRQARADLTLALSLGADPTSKEARELRDRLDAEDGRDQSGGK